MSQVIKHAKKEHEVEPLAERSDVIDGQVPELDVETIHVGDEAGLSQILLLGIETEHSRGSAAFHLHRIEPGVAANIQDRFTGQVAWNRIRESLPFNRRIVAQEV